MNGVRMSGLINELKNLYRHVEKHDNRFIFEVEQEKIFEISNRLKDLGFDHVKGVTAVDYPNEDVIEIIYYIGSYSKGNYAKLIIELKIILTREDLETPSLIGIWQSSEYAERETYEMFGVKFQGHPKLERLLLPDDFEGKYPLRKEFKIPEEGIDE